MGIWNWLLFGRRESAETPSTKACGFCSDPVNAALIDLDVEGPKDCFLQQCPQCGQYWGGHGYQLHFRWAFTPEEAAQHFPGIREGLKSSPPTA
jgi:hypothetical protein